MDVPASFWTVLVLLLVAILGCGSSDPSVCTNKPVVKNPMGFTHGAPCTQDSDCLYGVCNQNPITADFPICTKDCSCGQQGSCDLDDMAAVGLIFTCVRPSGNIHCVPACTTLDDCTKISDRYTACAMLTVQGAGVRKLCVVQ